ncbi:hypothetical protein MLD38_015578 [Melastoma candidum]|uniref:Uncharacterized protein n=1 Tax=Melastoma candidum TaxID=119954 RepID=A0ACB9RH54_9MYRT|nr:hypothetical protein MLD38_015578 [Melastoma candidum]
MVASDSMDWTYRRKLGQVGRSQRFVTDASGESSHQFDEFVTEDISDQSLVGASQRTAVSEVAIAAADSSLPVSALQRLIDGVHSFTGFNWWASIALTTIVIRGATAMDSDVVSQHQQCVMALFRDMPGQ